MSHFSSNRPQVGESLQQRVECSHRRNLGLLAKAIPQARVGCATLGLLRVFFAGSSAVASFGTVFLKGSLRSSFGSQFSPLLFPGVVNALESLDKTLLFPRTTSEHFGANNQVTCSKLLRQPCLFEYLEMNPHGKSVPFFVNQHRP